MGDVEPKQPEQPPEEAEPKEVAEEEEKPAEEAEAEEGEEAAEESGEEPEGEEAKGAEEKEGQPPAEKPKKVGGWQRRIAQLERDKSLLLEQLGRNGQQQQNGKPEKDKTPEEKAAEYIDSLVEKRLEARETQRQHDARMAEFQRRTAEVRAAHADFDDVVSSADMPISPALEQALLTSEHGPSIMYQLASNPAELARMSALLPLDAARAVGRLEAQLSSSTATPKTTKPALRPPVPPTSVNGKAPSTRDPENLSIGEYKRAMRLRSGQR